MAIKKVRIRPEGGNNYADILHPETSADVVIESENKMFVSSAEKTNWNNKADKTYVDTELSKKVDKIAGKQLSTEDYTTAEKNKLAGIEEGANKTIINNTLTSTSTTQALSASQGKVLKDGLDAHKADYMQHTPYAIATGNDSYAVSIPGISSLVEGMSVKVKFTSANTGASTLNINGLGEIPIKKSNGNDLSAGNIKAGQICHLVYTGSVFQLLGEGGEYGTAHPNHVLEGITFGTEDGLKVGTMLNRGAVTNTITTQGGSYTIPAGYHNGSGKVTAQFANLIASNIREGVNIGGIVGTLKTLNLSSSGALIRHKVISLRAQETVTETFSSTYPLILALLVPEGDRLLYNDLIMARFNNKNLKLKASSTYDYISITDLTNSSVTLKNFSSDESGSVRLTVFEVN